MQKCWLLRAVVRDRRTNKITGYGATQTIPLERAMYHMKNNPMCWELVSEDGEMPDDDRGNPHKRQMNFQAVDNVAQLSAQLSAPTKLGKKGD